MRYVPGTSRVAAPASIASALLLLAACASVELQESGGLSSYSRLGEPSGLITKSRTYADKAAVKEAKTVRILPTTLSVAAAASIAQPRDRALIAKVLDRAVCVALSDTYEIVPTNQTADLTVRATIAQVTPTNQVAAGLSTAVTLGSGFVLPVSVPRLPIGLGAIGVEGEVIDRAGAQRAAIVWARGADILRNSPRVSEVGDAYALAAAFGDDFARLIATGAAPALLDVQIPSFDRISAFFGGTPKYPACEVFGRAPGVPGLIASAVGAPPEWTDKAGDAAR